jgi:hypothetical protein
MPCSAWVEMCSSRLVWCWSCSGLVWQPDSLRLVQHEPAFATLTLTPLEGLDVNVAGVAHTLQQLVAHSMIGMLQVVKPLELYLDACRANWHATSRHCCSLLCTCPLPMQHDCPDCGETDQQLQSNLLRPPLPDWVFILNPWVLVGNFAPFPSYFVARQHRIPS